jgi:hypothetical protein
MGRGGQSHVKKSKTSSKLSHLPDAELRKWAVDYGVKEQATREGLLEALVSKCLHSSVAELKGRGS